MSSVFEDTDERVVWAMSHAIPAVESGEARGGIETLWFSWD